MAEGMTEKQCNEIINKYENAKTKVDQLDKVNKGLEGAKDKKLIEKYNVNKNDLEKDLQKELGITKDKPRFLQTKAKTQEQEKAFRGKIETKLNELKEKYIVARDQLQIIKQAKKITHVKSNENDRGKTKENTRVKTQTQTRGR